MAGKKPLSPTRFHKQAQKRVKKAVADAKIQARHYSKGDKLIKQVSKTLKKVAATHPHPKARKQVKMALKRLNQAHAEFGNAGTCADGGTGSGTTYNK
jgi:ribosome maturation protein Sdo1